MRMGYYISILKPCTMRYKTTLLLVTLLLCRLSFSQKITLSDLTSLCNKKNWEDVNQILLSKGWTYYDSEKGTTYRYNTITWSFDKDYYSDKAGGWFYLYTYEGYPNKISFSVFNKTSYSLIQNSISSSGFKLIDSEIEDNEITSTYGNSSYTLIITTQKRNNDSWDETSLTAYTITLIKKAGIYDEDNGKKTDYYDYSDIVEAEYTLLNGKMNGLLKVYHINGNLKKTGNYLNGLANGKFTEYDEVGNKTAEYTMLNDEKNGLLTFYEDMKISYTTNFIGDLMNGAHTEYYYDEQSGKLIARIDGEFLENEKNGIWKTILIEDNEERILSFDTFTRGMKNGAFQEVNGDTLIIGSYRNGKLNGNYNLYIDLTRLFLGGIINTKIEDLVLLKEGSYFEGLENGYWKYYDISGALRREGSFSNGQQTGEWRYYYTKWTNDKGESLPYSNKLFLEENYLLGKLNGKSKRYSYLDEEKFLCSDIYENRSSFDTCSKFIYTKALETSFYKNGKLNGPYELKDSLNNIVVSGSFKNDKKDGEWIQRYTTQDISGESYYYYQKGSYADDEREGKWTQYFQEGEIVKTINYKNGELNGEYVEWIQFNKPREKKYFNNGKLTSLLTYDSLGNQVANKYEIFKDNYNSYMCKWTTYFDDGGYVSQEYWLNKEEEIDHNWFELTFLIAIGKYGSNGYKDGEYLLYNAEGNPIITGTYLKEIKINLWTYYYYEQGIKIESNFSNDIKTDEKYLTLSGEVYSGEFTYQDEENAIKEIRNIKGGLRNGKTIYIDLSTDKTIKKESYQNGILK